MRKIGSARGGGPGKSLGRKLEVSGKPETSGKKKQWVFFFALAQANPAWLTKTVYTKKKSVGRWTWLNLTRKKRKGEGYQERVPKKPHGKGWVPPAPLRPRKKVPFFFETRKPAENRHFGVVQNGPEKQYRERNPPSTPKTRPLTPQKTKSPSAIRSKNKKEGERGPLPERPKTIVVETPREQKNQKDLNLGDPTFQPDGTTGLTGQNKKKP